MLFGTSGTGGDFTLAGLRLFDYGGDKRVVDGLGRRLDDTWIRLALYATLHGRNQIIAFVGRFVWPCAATLEGLGYRWIEYSQIRRGAAGRA